MEGVSALHCRLEIWVSLSKKKNKNKNIQQILFLIFPATLTSLSFNSLINIKQQSKALNRYLMNEELNE